jgi:hypothetical protein
MQETRGGASIYQPSFERFSGWAEENGGDVRPEPSCALRNVPDVVHCANTLIMGGGELGLPSCSLAVAANKLHAQPGDWSPRKLHWLNARVAVVGCHVCDCVDPKR